MFMKCIVMLFTLYSVGIWAKPESLLKCLGAEEKVFHQKKDTGPSYDLNQRLISEMIQIPRVSIEPIVLNKICATTDAVSLRLLEASIVQGKNIFMIDRDVEKMQRQVTEGMIDDYVEATKEILLSYIAAIQTQSPTPECLTEEIKGLDKFFFEIKYLQEDVPVKTLFEGKDQVTLERLKDYREAFDRCRERLKIKLKSKSTASPKKV